MASPQAEKAFNELWSKINNEIEQNHKLLWPRIKGFLANAIGQTHSKATTAASVAGPVLSYFIKIPLLGTAIEQAINGARNYWNEKNIRELSVGDKEYDLSTKDWWVQKGLQAYIDSVRKYDDAANEYKSGRQSNCTEFTRTLSQLLYARYRLRRMENYYHMMAAFQNTVKQKLDQANREFALAIKHTQMEGPKFFEANQEALHLANCRDGCSYPWPGGISKPFNPGRSPTKVG